MTTFPAITDETGDLAPAGGFRGPSRLTPVTVAKWLMAQGVTTRAGDNDLESILAELNAGRDPSIETYDALPDATDHPVNRVVYIKNRGFFRNTSPVAAIDGRFGTETFRFQFDDGVFRNGYGFEQYLAEPAGFLPGNPAQSGYGSSALNPNARIYQIELEPSIDGTYVFSIRIQRSDYGTAPTSGDQLQVILTDNADSTDTVTIPVGYTGPGTIDNTYQYYEFQSVVLSAGAQLTKITELLDGNTVNLLIYTGSSGTTRLFSAGGSRDWTDINNEVFSGLINRLEYDEEQVRILHGVLALLDLGSLPENLEPYADGRIISVRGETFKKVSTDGETEDIFEGIVGPPHEVGTVVWRGASTRNAPEHLAVIGEITSNPDNVVAFIGANNLNQIQLCVLESAYVQVKGAAVATGDTLGVSITYPESSAADTATLTYVSGYDTRSGGHYLTFRASGTARYDMSNVADDQRFQLQVLDSSDGSAFFEHETDLPHWLEWEFTAERSNQAALNDVENEIGTLDDKLDRVQADIGAFHRTISPDWQRRTGNAGEIGAYGLTLRNVKAGQVYDVEAVVNIPDLPNGTYDTQFYFGVFYDANNIGRTIPFSGDDFHGDRQHSGDLGYIWEDANGRFLEKPETTTGLRPSDMAGYVKSAADNTTIKTAPAQWEAKKDSDSVRIWLYAWSRLTGTSESAIHNGSGTFRAVHGFSIAHPDTNVVKNELLWTHTTRADDYHPSGVQLGSGVSTAIYNGIGGDDPWTELRLEVRWTQVRQSLSYEHIGLIAFPTWIGGTILPARPVRLHGQGRFGGLDNTSTLNAILSLVSRNDEQTNASHLFIENFNPGGDTGVVAATQVTVRLWGIR